QVQCPDDAVVGAQSLRVTRHEVRDPAFGPVQLLPGDAVEEVALGKDTFQRSAVARDEEAADVVLLQVLDRFLQRRARLHGDGGSEPQRADELALERVLQPVLADRRFEQLGRVDRHGGPPIHELRPCYAAPIPGARPPAAERSLGYCFAGTVLGMALAEPGRGSDLPRAAWGWAEFGSEFGAAFESARITSSPSPTCTSAAT